VRDPTGTRVAAEIFQVRVAGTMRNSIEEKNAPPGVGIATQLARWLCQPGSAKKVADPHKH